MKSLIKELLVNALIAESKKRNTNIKLEILVAQMSTTKEKKVINYGTS